MLELGIQHKAGMNGGDRSDEEDTSPARQMPMVEEGKAALVDVGLRRDL